MGDIDGHDWIVLGPPTDRISGHAPDEKDRVYCDITEQKERKQERQLFRKAVEASGHSINITDRNGVIEYVNPAFERMTGYTADEAIGRTPRILRSGAHDFVFYEELWETVLSGETWRNKIVNNTKASDRYIVDQTIAPVEDKNGEITHFVAINEDITEQREYEQTIEQQNNRLAEFTSVV